MPDHPENGTRSSIANVLAPDLVSGLYLGGLILWLAAGAVLAWRLGAVSYDQALHDSYYLVVHWRYVLSFALLGALFWGAYRAFEQVLKIAYSRVLGGMQCACFFAGTASVFYPLILVSSAEMPERYVDYLSWQDMLPVLPQTGFILLLISLLLFVVVLGHVLWRRQQIKDKIPK